MNTVNRFALFVSTLGVGLVVIGCNKEQPLAEPPPLEVVVSQPVSETISDWDIYTGTVDPRESVEVRSRVRGYIKEVKFKEGEEIAAGTPLFVIDSDTYEADLKRAKGELASWDAQLKVADETLVIYQKAPPNSITQTEMNKVVADKGKAVGGVDAARAKILEAELNIG
jgi:multidrug efflux pump subunit AcrA (membrane-fusion protein)